MNSEEIYLLIQDIAKEYDLPIRIVNILKSKSFKSEKDFYKVLEDILIKYTSNYLSPNHLISFYPQLKERKASKNFSCDLSGIPIYSGRYYYTYHPFLEDLKSGKVYVTQKEIKTCIDYVDELPKDLFTYEEWYYRLKNCYYENNLNNNVDFYHLSTKLGDNCLEPYELGISKKRSIRLNN